MAAKRHGRKRAEALQESEEKYRTLFQTMAQGVIYQDADGKIVSANPAAERILGLSLDQLQGRTSVDPRWRATHEDGSDFPGETHPSMVALRTGKEVRDVVMGVSNPRRESHLWISICAVPQFRPGESQPYQVYTTFDDITERKLAEEQIKVLARFPDENPNPVLRVDPGGTILYANASAEENLLRPWGVPPTGVLPASLAGEVAAALRNGKNTEMEMTAGARTFLLMLAPIAKAGYANLYARDITDRKKAEDALKVFSEAIASAFDCFMITDAKGNITYVNESGIRAFGYTPEEFSKLHITDLDADPQIAKSIAQKIAVEGQWSGEVINIRKNRLTFPSMLSAFVIKDDKGNHKGTMGILRDITDHKRAEQALRESEARYKALFAGAPEGILVADSETKRFRYANPAVCRMFGYNEEEFAGLSVVDIHPRESLDHVLAEFEAQLRREKTVSPDLPCLRKDGAVFVANISGIMIVLDGRKCNLGFFTDVTERKWAEEALKKSARLLMDTGEMAKVGGWELDLATKEVSWTEEVGRIHGVAPGYRPKLEEALDFYAPESRAAVEAVVKRTAETGEPYDLESLFIPLGSKDKIWVRSLGRAVYSGGKIVKLAGAFQNIDKYKRAEELLRESDQRFRTLVEAVTDYTYRVTVQDGRVVQTTHGPGCLGVTGYTPEELHADPELWFGMVHSEDRPAVFDQAARLSSGRKTAPMEHRIIHKNEETRWVRNTAVPRYDDRGQYTGYEGLIQDITEHRQLQEQFAQAQKMEAIGLLAGGVAHDFRNQLTVIKGYGEMLLRRSLVKDGGRELLEQILKAADRSATIAGQLLAFSRQQTLRPEVVSVNTLTGDMMKSLVQTLGEDVRLSIMPCGDLWDIRVDTAQFQQALVNLVLNARDAMPQGGQLTIETANVVLDEDFVRRHAGASAGRHIVLTVRDTGVGMDPETLGRLFEPFFTTKPVGEGTGLGLAMVHGFVAQSGGFIEVESRPGRPAGHAGALFGPDFGELGSTELAEVSRAELTAEGPGPAVPGGTTFRLYFPAVDDVAETAGRTPQAPDLPRGSGTVLVVEDEDAIRRMLLETLGECGYTVLTAGDAQEAMALIESGKEKIDLLITDVVMPGWSGPELARYFQAARPGAAVLMISGHTGRILTGHGVVPSEDSLLVKPFSSQVLAQTVRKVLGQSGRP